VHSDRCLSAAFIYRIFWWVTSPGLWFTIAPPTLSCACLRAAATHGSQALSAEELRAVVANPAPYPAATGRCCCRYSTWRDHGNDIMTPPEIPALYLGRLETCSRAAPEPHTRLPCTMAAWTISRSAHEAQAQNCACPVTPNGSSTWPGPVNPISSLRTSRMNQRPFSAPAPARLRRQRIRHIEAW